ncbi:MAG: ATP-binding protein [Oscillospiraceae bacterium]|jgi:anti-sigma regulatory factor (Ser/Thr protein kinase)|nr:ATP-binding protein [Oscillospiraceae bacterium]MBQ2328787.1 ATP-binding protein [Oscillospiraceae bacterium]MBQ5467575.1 ATP-binding protein [Oscillospiraceae bacterium]
MKELSLNILDIAMNSVKAGATLVEILIDERNGWRTLTIRDNGCGMSEDFLRAVTDPFTTTRTTRKVGMGLPLLKLAAEQTGGTMQIESSQGEHHGTTVTARFLMDHLDCVPLGDYAGTMVTLIQGSPDIDFVFQYRSASGEINLSTAEMRQILGDVPLNTPEVLAWVAESLASPEES